MCIQENSFNIVESSEFSLLQSEAEIYKKRCLQLQSKVNEQESLIHALNETIAGYDIKEKQSLKWESTQQFNDTWQNLDEILSDESDDEERSTYVDRHGRVKKKRRKNWD